MTMSVNVAPAMAEVPDIDPSNAIQIMLPGSDRHNRLEWLRMRRTGCGSSDLSAILGMSKYTASIDIWEEKTGRLPLLADRGQSEAAKWGRLLEPVIRDEYARLHGLQFRLVGMLRSQRWPWLICDPDGLIVGHPEGFEVKTVTAFTREWSASEIADHAELQAQLCMAVTGYDRWHVACLIGGQKPVFAVVERDDALIEYIISATKRFWFDHVLADEPPPPDDSVAYGAWLDRQYPADDDGYVEIDNDEAEALKLERVTMKAAAQEAIVRGQTFTNRVKALLGDSQRLVSGKQVLATWTTTKRFAEKRFCEEHPELVNLYTIERTTKCIDTTSLANDHPALYRQYCARPLVWKD